MKSPAGGWRTRFEMIRQALKGRDHLVKMMNAGLADARRESVGDGVRGSVAAIRAFCERLESDGDVTKDDVLQGMRMLADDMEESSHDIPVPEADDHGIELVYGEGDNEQEPGR